jgi:glycosyltransferase involved in cell wall biosynthesis
MKILWLSNKVISERDVRGTGTWLTAMARGVLESGEAELCNISEGPVRELTRSNGGALTQWIVPHAEPSELTGLPPKTVTSRIVEVIDAFAPDIIHIWGTEGYWGLITARLAPGRAALLEIQGLKSAIARVYDGGLSTVQKIACVGVKELGRGRSIFAIQHRYRRWTRFEREIIAGHRNILAPTDWAEAQVRAVNPGCAIYRGDCVLREPFYRSAPWAYTGAPVLFCSASYSAPFKGIHVAVRAAALLKRTRGDIQLRIAGLHQRFGLRRDGYIAWVCREIARLGLEKNVVWLGPLKAEDIVREMAMASAMLVPTYIENCCTAMQEAMLAGIPVIASYAGGLPSLARDEESALFFPAGDEVHCARQCERVMADRELAERLSEKSRAIGCRRNAPDTVVARQLDIYRTIIRNHKWTEGTR